jgi:hypothetical protein
LRASFDNRLDLLAPGFQCGALLIGKIIAKLPAENLAV